MSMDFGVLDFAVGFNRLTAFPLDSKSYFESYDAAVAAAATAEPAGSTNTAYYYGNPVVVVENGKAKIYQIQPDKTLSGVGEEIVINENVFTKDAEGKLSLYGFATATAGAQLTVGTDGKLSWVKPDTTTVDGLSTKVATLETNIGNLQTEIDKKANSEDVYNKTDIDGRFTTVTEEIAKKANAADVYTKDEADLAIDAAVAGASHLTRQIVTAQELAAFIANPATASDNVIYMQKFSSGEGKDNYKEYMRFGAEGSYSIELIGDTSVDLTDYAKTADINTALESYAKTTVTDNLATQIAANATAISQKADTTVVETLSGKVDKNTGDIAALTETVNGKANQNDLATLTTTVEGHTADLATLTQTVAGKADASAVTELTTKVTKNTNDLAALTATVDGKVDKVTSEVDGKQVAWTLLSPTNKTKLDNLVLNEDGTVGISGSVAAEKVTGLADWVTGQRDSTPGLLSAADEAKLDGIAEGAQVNVIEAIKLAGQTENLAIIDKVVELPFATGEVAGIVKTSAEIGLDSNNALEVKSLNVKKLVQTEDVLLYCGGAAAFTY